MARAGGGGRKPPVNSSQLVSEKGAANNGPRDRFLYRWEKTVLEFTAVSKNAALCGPWQFALLYRATEDLLPDFACGRHGQA
jgi:hypothetical protein